MPKAPKQHGFTSTAAKHTPTRHKPRRRERRCSSRERGYTRRWELFRAAFLRAHPLCEFCAAEGRYISATVCDHDIPHRGDPDLFWDNSFTALCRDCHSGTKARMESRLSGDELLADIHRRKSL